VDAHKGVPAAVAVDLAGWTWPDGRSTGGGARIARRAGRRARGALKGRASLGAAGAVPYLGSQGEPVYDSTPRWTAQGPARRAAQARPTGWTPGTGCITGLVAVE
jgi:hypothetical protein